MTSSFSECITAHLEFSHGMTDLILLPDIVDKCCDFLFFLNVCHPVYAAQQEWALHSQKTGEGDGKTSLNLPGTG